MNIEDHLDNFYLHLQTLEVHYNDVVCIFFPCTLDGIIVVQYHILLPKSIKKWRGFKKIFLEKFVDDKTPTMLSKEPSDLKMEQKGNVKYFNQRFNHILKKFLKNMKPLSPSP